MKSNQKRWIFLVMCICVAVVLAGGFHYLDSIRQAMVRHAMENVLTVTQQQEQAFSNFVILDQERVHSFATHFSSCASTDQATIQSRMKAFDQVEAVYSVVNLEDGSFYNNKSSQTYQMGSADREEYQSFTGSGIRNSYTGLYTGTPMFGYYECFRFADGVPGLFQKGYESTKVSSEFSLSFYNNEGFAFVVTKEGDVLLRSVGSSGRYSFDNIFDSIDPAANDPDTILDFTAALNAHREGTDTFSGGDTDYVYTYVPVTAVDDWYLISIVPLSAIMMEADEIIANSQAMILVLAIILVITAVIVFTILQVNRAIEKKDHQLAYHKEQFNILSTFLAQNTDDTYIMIEKGSWNVEYVSSNIERVLGIPAWEAETSVRALRRAFYKDREPVTFEDLARLEMGEHIGPMETERINPQTQERRWFRETVYGMPLQNREMIVAYISDRTLEQKAQDTITETLQAVQVANKAKTTFLSSMSHDIRTPMNAIMGLITLIQEDVKDPDQVLEYTHRMDAASRHLLELINNILDMNKIESGSVTLSIGELSLAELIDNVNTIIRPQAKAKGQTFKVWVRELTNERLLGDSTRLSQILINILSNAVKYTQEGGRIEFSVQEMPQVLNNYSRIRFVVKDNGQGMSEEYQKVMFDPFSREQNSFTSKIQGTGLGMAITKSLVELMGGTIHVESRVGAGTTFTVELELRIQDQMEDSSQFWSDHGITKMIVADDDPDARTSVLQAMADSGVKVDCASDGEEAVQLIRRAREEGSPYDLILLDWKMPKLDGLESIRLLRKNYPEKAPIFFFTAYDWSDIEKEARESGVSHFLSKPFFISTFQDAIRKVVSSSRETTVQEQSVLEGKHILVAEDIEVNRMILGKILATRGASCAMAEDGRKVVEMFEASAPGEYDMIFMDIQMPELNGYDATRIIRASDHPSAKTIPIIAMTANAFADDVREALKAGMDVHVSKPIVLEQLENSIRKLLEDKKAAGK